MSHQQQSQNHHQQHQRNEYRQYQDRQRPGNVQEQRREFLWRERVKLEMQLQALALLQGLEQEYCVLEQRKASVEQEKPKLAAQIVLSGLAGSRSLPTERLFHYRRERFIQEEERLRQAMMRCQNDLAGLQGQIEVMCLELSFLN